MKSTYTLVAGLLMLALLSAGCARTGSPTATLRPTAPATGTPAAVTPMATVPATPLPLPTTQWVVYDDPDYSVTLRHPEGWLPQPGYDRRFAGSDGFFQLSAISGDGLSIAQVAEVDASHKMRPYGSQPTIESQLVQGQPARLILPSSDQALDMAGQAGLIVQLPAPIELAGQRYEYLILWADQSHIRAIAATLSFSLARAPTRTSSTPPDAVQEVLFALATQFRVPMADIELTRFEATDWPDGCLGVPMRDLCTEAIVPGYRVLAEIQGREYEYRTDQAAQVMLLARGPQHGILEPALTWESTRGSCRTLLLSDRGQAAVGPCDAPLTPLRLPAENARPEQWATFLTRFAPFEADTPRGQVGFHGEGGEEPSPGWQRAIAAWAGLMASELQFGRSGASWATALSWHRELPDQPGVCEFLQVESYGYAFSSMANCAGGDATTHGDGWLTDGELSEFDGWLSGRSTVDVQDLYFAGLGSQPMAELEVNALRNWAGAVYERQTRTGAGESADSEVSSFAKGCAVQPGQSICSATVAYQDARGVTQKVSVNYLLYLPAEYDRDGGQDWPLILFLHGSEERGKDPRVLTRQGLPKILATRTDFPFVVVSPQCPTGDWWWPRTRILAAFLDHVLTEYPFDPRRVYLTGLSMGGFGAWAMAYQYPERFAAVVPIAGGYTDGTRNLPKDICRMASLPIWAFHGEQDRNVLVGESQRVVDALRACGSDVRFTLYPDVAHVESWEKAYSDPELFDWLLQNALP